MTRILDCLSDLGGTDETLLVGPLVGNFAARCSFFYLSYIKYMTSLLDDFEKDCLVRIEHRASSKPRPFEEICIQESQHFPSATYFLMGVGFGVIAARVACTCIFTHPSVSNE